jgi:hypothetical protein
MSFYYNLNNYIETNIDINKFINKTSIYKFQSNIIKEYNNILKDTDEYFEDRMMEVFDKYFNRCDNEDTYDEICNNIIFIYYESIMEIKEYYGIIYKKKRIYL